MKKSYLTIILILFGLFVFNFASAAGLVPCGGAGEPACDLCYLFEMVANIFTELMTKIIPVIAVLMIIIGGVIILIGRGKPEEINKAKSVFTAIAIGLLIVYGAWIMVNLFFQMIGVQSWTGLNGGWWKVNCTHSSNNPVNNLPDNIPSVNDIINKVGEEIDSAKDGVFEGGGGGVFEGEGSSRFLVEFFV